jgi:bifunctional non-homologous end joining protein LigD
VIRHQWTFAVSPERVAAEVDGQRIVLSNLDKVLYPRTGFTKGQVLQYYTEIAEVMVPHLAQRPLTLKRYPNGVEGEFFYEKHAPSNTPEWVDTLSVPAKDHEPIEYVLVNDRATLIWVANLASLEMHVPQWHAARSAIPARPDFMVFDLDPGPGCSIVDCCEVALWIGERLGEDKLFAKTSGSKGLQLYTRVTRATWESTSEGAHELARALERDHPTRVVSIMTKSRRQGKILIDWSQNSPAKTTVAAYSLRGQEEPTVSTPVTWDEVHRCAKSGNPAQLRFLTEQVLRRVHQRGDEMAPLLHPRASKVAVQRSR